MDLQRFHLYETPSLLTNLLRVQVQNPDIQGVI